MKELLIDNLDIIIILLFIITVLIVGGIQRRRENKLLGKQNKNEDVLGTLGKAMGASVFRGFPTDITGMPPSGHFQKPDFSFDEEAEEEYVEKYEK